MPFDPRKYLNHLVRFAFVVLAIISIFAVPVQARQSLAKDVHITKSLVAAGVGDTLRQNCPSISARYFVVLRKARALERYAADLGYSGEEIERFIGSKKQRRRIRKAVRSYLVENGVVEGAKETYCSLGRAEIAKDSLIGQLIWSW